eukprot:SAG31_NODE_181_length_21114_cov_99.705211_7_plen_66_part_00
MARELLLSFHLDSLVHFVRSAVQASASASASVLASVPAPVRSLPEVFWIGRVVADAEQELLEHKW